MFHKKNQSNGSGGGSVSRTGADSPYLQKARSGKTEIRELEAVFKKFDVNGDGKISSKELGAIMASLGNEVPEEVLEKAITEIDRKGDGYINFEEFVELNTKGMDQNDVLENLKDAFSVYDIDGNGAISAEELHEVLRSLGDECSIGECRKMIGGVDKDGDGTIDFEEFKIMMTMGSRRDNVMGGGGGQR
ncbi:hypothetical protein Bca4012_062636 [Brassica carinata]|uniref:EF-hand domain-containing protein n=1 Tax=Brassica carinata TaxID=52824 RepID=A0A8X7QKI0_BRACI|nr:hypothetical protein Bca52824_064168 [Brassica carinata]